MAQVSQLCLNHLKFYNKNGYVVIRKAIQPQICKKAIQQFERMKISSGFLSHLKLKKNIRTHTRSNFFVDQFNKTSYFFQNTYSDDPNLDQQSIIKIGPAVHTNKIFEQITYGQSIQKVYNELEIRQSIVIQSILLQKLPKKGGKVTIHQDSTYLLYQPDTIKGFWIPLVDVNKQNGCIWVIPRSHQGKLYYKFRIVNGKPIYDFDGPIDFNQQDAIPIEMEKGDLLIMNGKLLHLSKDNLSKKSRYAYTWHTMEKKSKWSHQNWLSFEQISKYNLLNL